MNLKQAGDLLVPWHPTLGWEREVFLLPSYNGQLWIFQLNILKAENIPQSWSFPAFQPEHPLCPLDNQRALTNRRRKLYCQGGQCCRWGFKSSLPKSQPLFNFFKNHFHSSLPKLPPLFFWIKILNQLFEGEKDCTLALNFGGGAETEDNVPARFQLLCFMFCQVTFLSFFMFCHLTFPPTFLTLPCRVYEQPLLLQPDPNTLILEGHIHANPKPKVLHNAL